jgi:exodeoxyribonuclease V alpha subunit
MVTLNFVTLVRIAYPGNENESTMNMSPSEYFGRQFPGEIQPLATELYKNLMEGSICVDLNDLSDDDKKRLEVHKFLESKGKLVDSQVLSLQKDAEVPFVLYRDRLYLQRYFRYEREIVGKIESLIFRESKDDLQQIRREQLEGMKDFILSHFREPIEKTGGGPDFQLVAALQAFLNNFTIVTGGPGVGKTTSMKKFLSVLFKADPDMRVILCAPTGKAAQRMKETLSKAKIPGIDEEIIAKVRSIGEQARTIHKTLGSKGPKVSPYFKHNADNPLECDLLIVDESSMIDVALFAKLMAAVPDHARVVLMGDKDQLASVEAASIFGDLCIPTSINVFTKERVDMLNGFFESGQHLSHREEDDGHILNGHVIELRHSHRFGSDSGIGILSKAVIAGDADKVSEVFGRRYSDTDFDQSHDPKIFNAFVDGFKDYVKCLSGNPHLSEGLVEAFRLLNSRRILVAIREGDQGLHTVNRSVEKQLASALKDETGRKILDPSSSEYYEFRPFMVTRNNYTVSPTLYNGDVGIIARDEQGDLKAWFQKDGEIKAYPPGQLGAVETNFAQTIHKSQGSEYDRVMVILPKARDVQILTRELLYTGITRAVSHVALVASKEVVEAALSRKVQRMSGIQSAWD